MVHSTESFGAVMALGFGLLSFCRGCHMRCQYCHNPDTWAMETNKSRRRTVDDVCQKPFSLPWFLGRQGGITVSGGKPLADRFLDCLFTKTRKKELKFLVLDTCALPFRNTPRYLEKFNKLMAVTDLVLLDIKEINDEQHRIVTSQTNKISWPVQNIYRILGNLWIRHVLVPGLTDRDDDLIELGKFVKTLKNVDKFEILPIIRWVSSWRELGIPYSLEGVKPPTADRVKNAKNSWTQKSYQDYNETCTWIKEA